MTYNTGAAARSRLDPTSGDADNVDRILLASCAAIWLAALGSAVAATVALVDLGSGHPESSDRVGHAMAALRRDRGVGADHRRRHSAAGAGPAYGDRRPRAGRGAGCRPAAGRTQATARAPEPQRSSCGRAGARRDPSGRAVATRALGVSTFDAALPPAVDRLWLRCAVVIASAIGLALLAIGIATYLMAAGHDAFAWAAYVVAGLVTVAMPAIPWIFLRQLHELLDASGR